MNGSQRPLYYTCSAGETFDSVALSLYGDEKHACDLLCANPAYCHLLRFRGGEVLEAPVVEVPDASDDTGASVTTPPWKE